MALTASLMLPLGTPCPDFALPDPSSGGVLTRDDVSKSQGLLVIFMCNHCPYVKHILDGIKKFSVDYANKEIGIVAISSNDVENYPDDAPEYMAELKLGFPYLYDESQQVAKAFDAVCTPEFYLFDASLKLVYRGQFDDSRPGNGAPVTGADLRDAMDNLIAGEQINADQKPGMGCNIKWKA